MGRLILLMWFLTGWTYATVPIQSFLNRDSVAVGEPIQWILRIHLQPGERIFWHIDTSQGTPLVLLHVADTIDTTQQGIYWQRTFSFAGYDSLDVQLPSVSLILDYPDAGADTFHLAGPKVKIRLVPVDMSGDIEPPQPIPLHVTWWERLRWWLAEYWWIFLIALLPVIFWWLWRWWQRRRPAPPPRPLTPYETFIQTLQELRSRQLAEQRRFQELYDMASDALRRYIEEELNLPALEMTTTELVAQLPDELPRSEIAWALQQADAVKFARVEPTVADAYAYLDTIQRLGEQIHQHLTYLKAQENAQQST